MWRSGPNPLDALCNGYHFSSRAYHLHISTSSASREGFCLPPGSWEDDLPIRQCLISLIGWCSLLFLPSRTISHGAFDLDTQGAKCFSRTTKTLESAQRPIDELLRSFGELLPKKWTGTTHTTDTHGSLKFQVFNLKIATLKKLANVKIVWVDTMSAHLDFDPTTATLCIFKAPSYCKLNPSEDTFLSMLVFSPAHQRFF